MNAMPHIIVQLVHIEGPLKGKIQEFSTPEILIGRHPDCQVQFPKDVATLSRRHAKIVREGNRFKLIDQSTNGTFVNGKQIAEAYLKDGDVITFAEGGPKASFLTQVSDQPAPQPQVPISPKPVVAPQLQSAGTPPSSPVRRPSPAQQPVPPPAPSPSPQPAPPLWPSAAPPSSAPRRQSVKAPFAIQYGPALKSFQALPITLGKGSNCDFIVDHPALNDQQVQIYFDQGQYWVKDLTGTNAVLINGMPIAGQAALQADMELSLSPQGPKFRFLGGGRLAEVEEPLAEAPDPAPQPAPDAPKAKDKSDSIGQKAGTVFKKFFT